MTQEQADQIAADFLIGRPDLGGVDDAAESIDGGWTYFLSGGQDLVVMLDGSVKVVDNHGF